jgi:hypothetical protein
MSAKLRAPLLWVLTFLFTFAHSDVGSASEDFKSIQMATITSALAEDLNSGKLSNEMRELLLQSASKEDQQNIKSLLAKWKKPTDLRYEAQFDHLVIFRKGAGKKAGTASDEVFRIFPKPNSSGAYYINGREWTQPTDGNTFKSLNQFFRASDSQAQNSVFEILQSLVSTANALSQDLRTTSGAAAFYYALSGSMLKSFDGESAYTRLSDHNPTDKLLRISGGFFRKVWDGATGKPKEIQCTPSGAKGRVLVGKEPLEFQTTGDGRVIYRMFDDKRTTFQAKSDITRFYEQEATEVRGALERYKSKGSGWIAPMSRDFCDQPVYAQVSAITKFCQNPQIIQALNRKRLTDDDNKVLAGLIENSGIVEALESQKGGPVLVHSQARFSECQDASCTAVKTSTNPTQSMVTWLGDGDPAPVGLALNHVPRDQRDLGYVIDFDCPKGTKCQNLVIKNTDRMNPKSLAEAQAALAAANDHYKKMADEHQLMTRMLAPLHGCCADEACRNSDFGKSLKFVRTDEGSSSAKPTGK